MELVSPYSFSEWQGQSVPRDSSRMNNLAWGAEDESIKSLLGGECIPTSDKASNQAWQVLTQWLNPEDLDAGYWWRVTGAQLAVMLELAGYNEHTQYTYLLFHLRHIVKRLGPAPTVEGLPRKWRSFMTDDFSPIEYSWTWDTTPKVRYAIEAIGPYAGSANDLFNQTATLELVNELKCARPDIDWQLFDLLRKPFNDTGGITSELDDYAASPTGLSSFMLGFELWGDKIGAKAYLRPNKARFSDQSVLNIATKSLQELQKVGVQLPAYTQFLEFLGSDSERPQLTFLAAAIDCVSPTESRFKLYVRSSRTSFESVCYNLTSGCDNHPLWTASHIEQLKDLWQLVLGLDTCFSVENDLPIKQHQTAGILYNFDVRPENSVVHTKVYIPVKHYGRNDFDIAKGLVCFLRKQGNDRFAYRFLQMLTRFCAHRLLDSSCGIQTYVSCEVKKGSLALTSYLGPEIYHRARYERL